MDATIRICSTKIFLLLRLLVKIKSYKKNPDLHDEDRDQKQEVINLLFIRTVFFSFFSRGSCTSGFCIFVTAATCFC